MRSQIINRNPQESCWEINNIFNSNSDFSCFQRNFFRDIWDVAEGKAPKSLMLIKIS